MIKSVDYKVPNGKLLRIDYEIEGDNIKYIKIYGDFFMYPEEGIEKIECALIGNKNNVKEKFEEVIKLNGITIIGFNSNDIFEITKRFFD